MANVSYMVFRGGKMLGVIGGIKFHDICIKVVISVLRAMSVITGLDENI